MIAPDSRAKIAVTRKGSKNQVGSRVARAPTGSRPMFSDSSSLDPANIRPKVIRTTGPKEPPKVFQKMMEEPLASRD